MLQQSHQAAKAQETLYAYDQDNRLVIEQKGEPAQTSRYHYDQWGRRVLSQEGVKPEEMSQGTLKSQYVSDTYQWQGHEQTKAVYNANGQPQTIGNRQFKWDALGRLIEVKENTQLKAKYSYNHRGQRISKTVGGQTTYYLYNDDHLLQAEVNSQGKILRQYIYLADQPLAVIDTPNGKALAAEGSGWMQTLQQAFQSAINWLTVDEHITWLHTNHLNAPEAATNEKGQPIWRASYTAYGKTQIQATSFTLNLRLPGQYEDQETGLHYNWHRYYDPQRGSYLTPDPLGTPDGPNPYAYVRNNPLNAVDPWGLILFAFDGTENASNPNHLPLPTDYNEKPNLETWYRNGNGEKGIPTNHTWAGVRSSLTNVARFRDFYNDGRARYISGVGAIHEDTEENGGNILPVDGSIYGGALDLPDRGGNFSGLQRIERMVRYFEDEAERFLENSIAMNIDIVGFSRGAAQAREFANRIVRRTQNGVFRYTRTVNGREVERCQQVNFRFMGLWDTVLGYDGNSSNYNFAIPTQFRHVAHAVALNEYRSSNGDLGIYGDKNIWNQRNPLTANNHYGGFALESIGPSSNTPGRVRIEMGFIGSHSDIGGGYPGGENQLSLVALNWMVAQARQAQVNIRSAPPINMNNPVIHDQSTAIHLGDPRNQAMIPGQMPNTIAFRRAEDRWVNYPCIQASVGATCVQQLTTTQRNMTFNNRSLTNAQTHTCIDYTERNIYARQGSPQLRQTTGQVHMRCYTELLRNHGYQFDGGQR
jgi:RHS repeat-associated protein